MGFARIGALGVTIALGIWFVFVPLDLVVFVTPIESVQSLVIGRELFFIAILLLSAIMFLTLRAQQVLSAGLQAPIDRCQARGAAPA